MSTTTKPLHIVSLKINNILRIKAVELVPNAPVVTLTGDNESGKSSILNTIAMILGGSDFVPVRPIRDGASKGEATLDLGDILVEIKFNKSGKSIEVRAKDGNVLKSPQAVLNSLWSKMCDPVQFIRLSESTEGQRKQGEILRQLVGLDFTKMNADKKKAYDDRTLVNRDLAQLKAKLASFPLNANAPDEEVKVADLMDELNKIQASGRDKVDAAQRTNQQHGEARKALTESRRALAESKGELSSLEIEIKELQDLLDAKTKARTKLTAEIEAADALLITATAQVEALEDVNIDAINQQNEADEKPIKDRINQADDTNIQVRSNKRHHEIKKEIADKQKKSDALTAQIDGVEAEKARLLSEAKFPLPGLSFDEDGVLLNGVPFAQGSQAQQLKAAIAIGLALKPRVRVILLRDASLFDEKSMAEVAAMAEAEDAQIIQEVVGSKDPSAIVIQDGEIKE